MYHPSSSLKTHGLKMSATFYLFHLLIEFISHLPHKQALGGLHQLDKTTWFNITTETYKTQIL